jgi:hypothetical protein
MIELVKIFENGAWGFLNEAGRLVTPVKYHDARTFAGGYAAASLKEASGLVRWALLNYEGKGITPFKYEEILQHYTWNYTLAKAGGFYGFVDDQGREATQFIFTEIGEDFFYHEGLANYVVVKTKEGKSGVIDQRGKTLVPFIYEAIEGCWDCEGGLRGTVSGEWKNIPLPLKK